MNRIVALLGWQPDVCPGSTVTTNDVPRDRHVKQIFSDSFTKQLRTVAARKLDMLDAAQDLMDLRAPPSNHLEKLKGDLAGFWSVRVNEQYRVIFKFAHGNANAVQITDYH
jgi:proteic killer suppression protein